MKGKERSPAPLRSLITTKGKNRHDAKRRFPRLPSPGLPSPAPSSVRALRRRWKAGSERPRSYSPIRSSTRSPRPSAPRRRARVPRGPVPNGACLLPSSTHVPREQDERDQKTKRSPENGQCWSRVQQVAEFRPGLVLQRQIVVRVLPEVEELLVGRECRGVFIG